MQFNIVGCCYFFMCLYGIKIKACFCCVWLAHQVQLVHRVLLGLFYIGSILSCPSTSTEVAPGQGPLGRYKIRVWGPSQKRLSRNNMEETREDFVLCGPHTLFYNEKRSTSIKIMTNRLLVSCLWLQGMVCRKNFRWRRKGEIKRILRRHTKWRRDSCSILCCLSINLDCWE